MAVDKHIEAGNKAREAKKYEEAIAHYDGAIKENSQAFKAHYEKSIALQRWGRVKAALFTLKAAEVIAFQRGTRALIAQVLFRYATLYLTKGDPVTASKFLNTALRYSYDENEITLWRLQVKSKAKKLDVLYDENQSFGSLNEVAEFTRVINQDDETHNESSSPADVPPQSEQERIEEEKRELELKMLNKDNLYPKAKDLKIDWFQSSGNVTVTLFIKNVPKDSLKVNFTKDSATIIFPKSSSSEFTYEVGPLYSYIDPESSSFLVFQTKLELTLVKAQQLKWKSLERSESEEAVIANAHQEGEKVPESVLNYPSSSKKNVDWSKLSIDDDEKEEGTGDENAFFKQLYANADDDTRRAMMKSFIESNGTALSTNWEDVSKKTYETTPPDGMEAKKW